MFRWSVHVAENKGRKEEVDYCAREGYLSEKRTAEISEPVSGESVRAVVMCPQRVLNPDDIGIDSLELIGDKGGANPKTLIWEND
ncbi:hypothetical protein TNCV_1039311 [Trichonephila clavipes]|uniref:Uncharacterized protein n=1 Tax=Trichonephila clavipes TaxID=2585209 RepID=A0A8X6VW46_TRICX|nr:hypothetical protein TNCV_1039311 [Trichonephila clavipes]